MEKVLWTDEHTLSFLTTSCVWRKKGAAFDVKNTLSATKYRVGNILLCGTEGRMDSTECQQIPEADVLQLVRKVKVKRGWLLQ